MGKNIVKFINKFIGVVFAMLMFFLLLLGLYSLWDSKMVYEEASSAQWEAYKPTTEDTASFSELRETNPDVWGWLTIYGTNIDNPLLCSPDDPDLYLNHDALKRVSSPGALYIESMHDTRLQDFNTIIYGHHMARDLMFGGLDKFVSLDYLNEHKYGCISYINKNNTLTTKGLEIVGLIKTDAYDSSIYVGPILDKSKWHSYNEHLLNSMETKRSVPWNENKLVLLSTCASGGTNARTIVVCYVENEVHEDTFVKPVNKGIGINKLSGLFGFPWLGWVGLILLLSLFFLLLIYLIDKRKQVKNNKNINSSMDG